MKAINYLQSIIFSTMSSSQQGKQNTSVMPVGNILREPLIC